MLLEQVRRRASEEACLFRLLVPRAYWDADTEESAVTLEFAIPLLEDAAGGRVEGLVGDQDPFVAASAALQAGSFDEVIVSTLPARVSHWLRIDLPTCLQRFGLPVGVVTAKKADRPLAVPRGRAPLTPLELGSGAWTRWPAPSATSRRRAGGGLSASLQNERPILIGELARSPATNAMPLGPWGTSDQVSIIAGGGPGEGDA